MMIPTPSILELPFQTYENGLIRVSGTRVTLSSLIAAYQQGQNPESIHSSFPTVPLADIYAIIAYYLHHQTELEAYLQQQDTEGQRIRAEWEAKHPPITREELVARLNKNRESK
jgi:uncharacterized protein (DUF433 family)